MAQDLNEKVRRKVLSSVATIEEQFRAVGLVIAAETASDHEEEVSSGSRHSFQWLYDQVESIERLAKKELKGKLFLYVPQERSKFWPTMKAPAFGKAVSESFPSSTFDGNSAGVCLASLHYNQLRLCFT